MNVIKKIILNAEKSPGFLLSGVTLLWVFTMRFIWNSYPLSGDSVCYYYWARYYLYAFKIGEYPLWNPFHFWGSPDNFDSRYFNEFNPFTYVPLGLNLFGVPFHHAYVIGLFLHYILMGLGFYCLALKVWNDRRWALLAYALILFSSLSVTTLFQSCAILILSSMIWFAYFAVSYAREGRTADLLGGTFALMLMLTTYIPFYFIVTTLIFSVWGMIVYFREIPKMIRVVFDRLKNDFWAWILSAVSLMTAALPGYLWYLEANGKDYLFNFRHTGAPDENPLAVNLKWINMSGIANYLSLEEIFSWHDMGNPAYLYISILVYFCILLGAWNTLTRRSLWVFGSGLIILLISVTSVTWVHEFFYQHLFIFRLFRNIFFFIFIAVPVLIFFGLDQIRSMIEFPPKTTWSKIWQSLFIIIVCVGSCHWLESFAPLIWSTRAAIIAFSGFLVLTFFLPALKSSRVRWIMIFCLFLLEPLQVFAYRPPSGQQPYSPQEGISRPVFRFLRPPKPPQDEPGYKGYLGHFKTMEDDSGFINEFYLGTPWTYQLQKAVSPQILENYARFKFLVYDRVEKSNDDQPFWPILADNFHRLENTAYVSSGFASFNLAAEGAPSTARIIQSNGPDFSVESFGLNYLTLRTNFSDNKFLVYNDSYHSRWRAKVNGKSTPVYRANYAFKGLYLPRGENSVELKYEGMVGEWFYQVIILYFFVYFCGFLMILSRKRKPEPAYVVH